MVKNSPQRQNLWGVFCCYFFFANDSPDSKISICFVNNMFNLLCLVFCANNRHKKKYVCIYQIGSWNLLLYLAHDAQKSINWKKVQQTALITPTSGCELHQFLLGARQCPANSFLFFRQRCFLCTCWFFDDMIWCCLAFVPCQYLQS